MKPIKAWMIVDEWGDPVRPKSSMGGEPYEIYSTLREAETMAFVGERIVRVEIRQEVT